MGRDKATLPTPSGPMAAIVVRAMLDAGAGDVLLVGGEFGRLLGGPSDGLGGASRTGRVEWVPDLRPGSGPLGGVATAAASRPERILLVCACDLPGITGDDLRPLVEAVRTVDPDGGDDAADIAVGVVDGVAQWSSVALSVAGAAEARRAFDSGERALRSVRFGADLVVAQLRPTRPEAFHDVDRPADLPVDWAAGTSPL